MFNRLISESSSTEGDVSQSLAMSYPSINVRPSANTQNKQSAVEGESATAVKTAHNLHLKEILSDELENVNDLPDSLNVMPFTTAGYDAVKRVLDIIAAGVILLILAPVLLVVAICVIVTSNGPVLFKQPRLGKDGQKFLCYKFRSMIINAESLLTDSPELAKQYMQQGFKIKNDPRVTTIGSFLRRTSLDELPQLINVLQGHISMIGPRPIVPKELSMYGKFGQKLLSVKPGLSGMWQASGRSDTSYVERVRLDMTYIDQRSLWLDMKLAFLTVWSVVVGKGAH